MNIKAYHADNSIFKAKEWVEACHKGVQGPTFAGANIHHQNRTEERRIRDLKELTCTMLIQTYRIWEKT